MKANVNNSVKGSVKATTTKVTKATVKATVSLTAEEKAIKALQPAMESKPLTKKFNKVVEFEGKIKAGTVVNSWERLQATANLATVQMFGMNAMIRQFLSAGAHVLPSGESTLTEAQRTVLTFENVRNFVNNSPKYKGLGMFTMHQVKLICNAVIKANDANTARAEKVERQNKATAKATATPKAKAKTAENNNAKTATAKK